MLKFLFVFFSLKTVDFEIRWAEENQTQGVQAIANDVLRALLNGGINVSKFIMNGQLIVRVSCEF